MGINFDTNTQELVFKPEYLTEQPALPIEVIKNGLLYMTIYPDQTTQEKMIEHYTVDNLWHLFDVVDKLVGY
jgi:hypothetical protein